MGLGRGLVKRVFCKAKSSIGARDGISPHQERNFGVEKGRWTSVRLYLCGDELNSVLVENDSASIRSSEANVMQSLSVDSGDEADSRQVAKTEGRQELVAEKEETQPTEFSEEEAAVLIQSVFRGFKARLQYEEIRKCNPGNGLGVDDPSGINEAASTEVLVDDSIENFSLHEENGALQRRVFHKSQSQVYRLKEEWDDSTLSSDMLRLRIQNKLEATTRRERALAYAFAQQLRTCSVKKKPTWSDSYAEPNTGWSWLERWMATRVPENSPINDCWSKHLEPLTTNRRLPSIAKKRLDLSIEEKESCGSNDVSVNFEGVTLPTQTPENGYGPVKSNLKPRRSVSERKTMSEYHRLLGSTKASRRVHCKEEEKRQKQLQAKSTGETKNRDTP